MFNLPTMAGKLSLDERLLAAARMAMRASVHFDLWWLTASREGRKEYTAIDDHWEHLRFLQHGQLVAVVGEVHALLDDDKRTISLPTILTELERHHEISIPSAKAALKEAKPAFWKLRLLRNNVFAHRTARKSYNAMFDDAKMTPDQFRELVNVCVAVTNEMIVALGGQAIEPSPLPREHYAKMLKLLEEHEHRA